MYFLTENLFEDLIQNLSDYIFDNLWQNLLGFIVNNLGSIILYLIKSCNSGPTLIRVRICFTHYIYPIYRIVLRTYGCTLFLRVGFYQSEWWMQFDSSGFNTVKKIQYISIHFLSICWSILIRNPYFCIAKSPN